MKAEDIAQWVIDNRYPQNEKSKVSDQEMYLTVISMIQKAQQPTEATILNGYLEYVDSLTEADFFRRSLTGHSEDYLKLNQ